MKKNLLQAFSIVLLSVLTLSFTTDHGKKKSNKRPIVHYCWKTNLTGNISCGGSTETLPNVCLELGGRDLPNTTVAITGAYINAPSCNLYTFVSVTSGATVTSDGTGSNWSVNGTVVLVYNDGTNNNCITLTGLTFSDGCALC